MVPSRAAEYCVGCFQSISLHLPLPCDNLQSRYLNDLNGSLIIFQEFFIYLSAVLLSSRLFISNIGSNKDILLALVLSSFGKVLHIFMLIWNFNELEYSWLANASVLTSNAEALAGKFLEY